MRFGTVLRGRNPLAVVATDEAVYPLPDDLTIEELVRVGLSHALTVGQDALGGDGMLLSEVEIQKPLKPSSVRDFVTFESHVEGVRKSIEKVVGVPEAWYDAPTFYFTNPHAILGPDAEVARPFDCHALDFELEVAAVMGRGGRSLSEQEAAEAIFGYTILNDWSARDLQGREMQVGLGPAKGKDFATSIGPWIVTADEFADRVDSDGFLTIAGEVSINGTVVGHDTFDHMGWTFATMVAYASRDSLVLPGDLLASGTTGGGGCLGELWGRNGEQTPPPLEPGDVVNISVEGLGSLTNTIVAGKPNPPLTPFRKAR